MFFVPFVYFVVTPTPIQSIASIAQIPRNFTQNARFLIVFRVTCANFTHHFPHFV